MTTTKQATEVQHRPNPTKAKHPHRPNATKTKHNKDNMQQKTNATSAKSRYIKKRRHYKHRSQNSHKQDTQSHKCSWGGRDILSTRSSAYRNKTTATNVDAPTKIHSATHSLLGRVLHLIQPQTPQVFDGKTKMRHVQEDKDLFSPSEQKLPPLAAVLIITNMKKQTQHIYKRPSCYLCL